MHWLILFYLALLSHKANASQTAETQAMLAIKSFAYFEDVHSEKNLGDVITLSQGESFKDAGPSPNFGFSASTFWLKVHLESNKPLSEPIILVFGYALIDHISVFVPTKTGTYIEQTGGRSLPFHQRALNVHLPHFIISPENFATEQAIFVRVKTSSSHQYPLQVFTRRSFQEKYLQDSMPSRLYMGAIAIMLAYNLIFLVMTWDLLYLIYVLFILSSSLQVLSVQGFTFQFFWPEAAVFNARSLPFLMFCSVILSSLFGLKSFHQMHRDRISSTALGLIICLGVFGICATPFLSYKFSIQLAVPTTMLSSLISLAVFLRMSYLGSRIAKFYLVSIGALLFASFIYSLKAIGILPYSVWTDNAPLIGSVLQITFMTFGLADRYRDLQLQNLKLKAHKIKLQRQLQAELQTRISIVGELAHRTNNPLHASYFAVNNLCTTLNCIKEKIAVIFDSSEANDEVNEFHDSISKQLHDVDDFIVQIEKSIERASHAVAQIRALSGVDGHYIDKITLKQMLTNVKNQIEEETDLFTSGKIVLRADFLSSDHFYGQMTTVVYTVCSIIRAIGALAVAPLDIDLKWIVTEQQSTLHIEWPRSEKQVFFEATFLDRQNNLLRPYGSFLTIEENHIQLVSTHRELIEFEYSAEEAA